MNSDPNNASSDDPTPAEVRAIVRRAQQLPEDSRVVQAPSARRQRPPNAASQAWNDREAAITLHAKPAPRPRGQ
jgi:hypothetical protein